MGNTLYLECNSGISGDMTVAALLDLGADERVLKDVLSTIPAHGFEIEITRVKKAGVDCCDFNVKLDHEHENHDHDMEYLHGHEHHHEGEHHHEHSHHHEEHHHHHEHRGMKEITEIINQTQMTEHAREIAKKIFQILAESEAKAHATDIDHVHFHEVGAIDSIVDIISVAVCVDNLGIENVIVPKLSEGTGTVRCQHGILSNPVPATANILSAYQLQVEFMDIQGEFITPTGAAIVAALMTSKKMPKQFMIQKIGLGAGKRAYERPSILRAMLIKEVSNKEDKDVIYKLESNIDDCSGEVLGYTMDKLFAAGARDVHYFPVYMKKNRPGWQLNVICTEDKIAELEQIIFAETTTIGIRRQKYERSVMDRKFETVETKYGEVEVKVCTLGDIKKVYPEYESVAKISREKNIPFLQVYNEVK